MYIHAYTLFSAVRPFGCNVILSSYTPEYGAEMYMIDPSGVSYVSIILSILDVETSEYSEKIKR